jgi:hypothetical protein
MNAAGFNTSPSVLSGLSRKASPLAKGRAMQAGADLGMEREKSAQELSLQRMQDESQQRQTGARNAAQQASNASQERQQSGALASRGSVFDMGVGFDYAGLQKRRQLNLQQSLLNGLARDF